MSLLTNAYDIRRRLQAWVEWQDKTLPFIPSYALDRVDADKLIHLLTHYIEVTDESKRTSDESIPF